VTQASQLNSFLSKLAELAVFYRRKAVKDKKNYFSKISLYLLIVFGLATIAQSDKSVAASLLENAAKAETIEDAVGRSSGMERVVDGVGNLVNTLKNEAYDIPGGPLSAALEAYKKQTGITIDYNASELEGIKTAGVKGSYSIKKGLNIILDGSGFQAVKQLSLNPIASSYVIQKAGVATATGSVEGATVLPEVTVPGGADYGYIEPNLTSSALNKGQNILLRDTPQQITVISQKQLSDRAPLSMADAVAYVPGIGLSQGEGNRDALVFRGQRNTGDFYIDGVRDDVQHFRDFYNIEKLEVIKGPNALIFGRAGSGGLVNRVRKEANWNPTHQLRFSGGSYDHKRFSLDTGYVLNDKVAFRFNGLYEHSGSHRHGVDVQRYGIAPTVTIKPTNKTKIVIQAELFKDDRVGDRGIPSMNGKPWKGGKKMNRDRFFGSAALSPTDTNKKSIGFKVEHRFTDNIKVRNRLDYAIFDKFYQNVYANGSVGADVADQVKLGAYKDETDRENFFNQTDLILNFNTGPVKHNMITGVEVFRQITDQTRHQGFFDGASSAYVSAYDPTFRGAMTWALYPQSKGKSHNRITTSGVGVYIQDHIELHPMVHMTAGVRYDRFEQDVRSKYDGSYIKSRDDHISPRFGLILKPLKKLSIYGSWSMTHQPRGGDQLKSLKVSTAALDPERFINIEGGVKYDVFDRLSFTTAFFQLSRTNVILTGAEAGETYLGKGTQTRGVEVGLNGNITDKWSVLGSYTYMEGKLRGNQKYAGNTLKEIPKNMYAVWSRYDFTPWFGAAFGVVGRSAMFTKESNKVTLPSYARVDAALYGKINKYLRVQANIQNLFDTNYYVSSHNDNNILPGAPITGRVTLIATY
tara:strand:- start:12690 stop:15281 length:2592 start_codon:yes stop_codon:yes gene_type:complete